MVQAHMYAFEWAPIHMQALRNSRFLLLFFFISDCSSQSLANGTRVEISSTMTGAKAWITVVSYLSPHLQPVVSLLEDVVKPSQTLKHPVASPCLNSP